MPCVLFLNRGHVCGIQMYIAVTNMTGTQASIECFKEMKRDEVKVTQNLISSLPSASDSNQPTSVAPRSGATRGLVALRLERGSVLFYSPPIFKYE